MEISTWAYRILTADTLDVKLFTPEHLTDNNPGPPKIITEPVRPKGMFFQRKQDKDKLPATNNLSNPDHRAICLHRFAGHELLAVEIMAYALLAFPEASSSFRKGVAHTLKEEQGHVRLYINRMEAFGLSFGDLPLYRHFWAHVRYISSPLHFVSMMNLTFEMANLDFAPMYREAFIKADDPKSALLMEKILRDEISHVRFGWKWFHKLAPKEAPFWDTWKQSLSPMLDPKRARGKKFKEEHRIKAGIDANWIESLKSL